VRVSVGFTDSRRNEGFDRVPENVAVSCQSVEWPGRRAAEPGFGTAARFAFRGGFSGSVVKTPPRHDDWCIRVGAAGICTGEKERASSRLGLLSLPVIRAWRRKGELRHARSLG
jgi:hypothetical protein